MIVENLVFKAVSTDGGRHSRPSPHRTDAYSYVGCRTDRYSSVQWGLGGAEVWVGLALGRHVPRASCAQAIEDDDDLGNLVDQHDCGKVEEAKQGEREQRGDD